MDTAAVYQSLDKLACLLEFDTVSALQAWMGDKLCKPYWDEYLHGWIEPEQSKGKKPNLKECRHVLKHLTDGESGGNRKFSDDFPDKSTWKSIDWQARLLCKVLSVNQADRHGLFYGRNLNELEMAFAAWQVILRLKLDHSLAQRPTKRAKVASEFEDWQIEDKPIIPTNPERGAARIVWTNIPPELEDQDQKSMIVITDLVAYTYETLLKKIDDGLELGKHGYRIDQLSVSEDSISRASFGHFLQHAATSKKRLWVELTTEKGLLESIIPSVETEVTSRQLLYDLMVAERISLECDLRERYWLWVTLQEASDSGKSPIKSDCEISHEAINSEEDCIRWFLKSRDQGEAEDKGEDENASTDDFILHDLTDEDIQKYREQEKWIDNQELQRQGHGEACEALGIPNPGIPRLPGMPISAKFEFWQPLAVKALKEFEKGYLRGGILADEVGIGKTFEAIGLEQYHWNQRKAAIESKVEVEIPQPTLVVVPPNLISQWASTIKAMSADLIVKIYYGGKQQDGANGVEYLGDLLSRGHSVFARTEETARTIIITSFRTLTSRHGPTALRRWIHDKIFDGDNPTDWTSAMMAVGSGMKSPPDEWEPRLNGLFKRLIVDEAPEIRNKKTLTATTLRWLQAPAVLLLSATPIWNGLSDILGLLYQLEPLEDPWSKSSLDELGVFHLVPWTLDYEMGDEYDSDSEVKEADALKGFMKRFDPWEIPSNHPASVLRYTSESVKHHIIKLKDIGEAGWRMREVLKACMIKRSYGSLVDGQVVGEALPAVQNISVHLEFTPEEQMAYNRVVEECICQNCKKKKKKKTKITMKQDEDDEVVWSTPTFRRLSLATSWTEFEFLLHYTAKKLKEFRKNVEFRKGRAFALRMLEDINRQKRKKSNQIARKNARNPEAEQTPEIPIYSIPLPADIKGILQSHCRGSPKLRYLLQLIAELVVLRQEKLLIFVTLPAQVQWLESVLRLLQLDAHSYRADMNSHDRQMLVEAFHRSPTKCRILITSFWVCCSGLNLHGHCRNLVFWDSAPVSVEQQALGRLKRVGATKTIRLFRLFIDGTFSTEQNMKYIQQALPGLMVQLNMEVFGEENDANEVSMGKWVVHDGRLLKYDDQSVLGLNLPVLDEDELLARILMLQQGSYLIDNEPSI
ncbi:hypothetical protein FQN49_003714 [Arthroderma sp. PD_2]|nr:hypothetical protein FQN49_003714 [Arthroderma sp. PD_2]